MDLEGKKGDTVIQLEPYTDSEGSHASSSRSRQHGHNEHERDDPDISHPHSPLLLLPSDRRLKPKRRILTPWTVVPLFAVAVVLSYLVGTWSAPRLPAWVKDHMPNFLLADDVYETSPGLLPINRPWTTNEEFAIIDLPHACQFIPDDAFTLLNTTQVPLIQVVAQNQTLTPSTNISTPVSVCVLISIPQEEFRNGSYPDAPVPGKGPDTIHMYLNSSDVIVTFPPLLPLPGQPCASSQFCPGNIIYFAETPIFNAGSYVVTADREFANWRWAQEWHIESGTNRWLMVTGEPQGDVVLEHAYEPMSLPATSFTVTGSRHLPSRPRCDADLSAAQGRWYKYRSFPVLERELVDEWGYTWQGDSCHLDYFSPLESLECLSNKTIHLYGDSMVRRIAKTIMSGGKWCLDPASPCQDEDDGDQEPVPKLDLDSDGELVVDEILREQHFQNADRSSISFGMNSRIYFTFLTALAGSSGTWMGSLYDEADRIPLGGIDGRPADYMELKPGAIARPPPEMAPADLVILGFGAWDQAFTDRFDEYEAALALFRDAFLQAYPNVPIILRLSNQWCCRGTHSLFRRYTGSRIQEFDARTRKVFNVTGATAAEGRMRVMDPLMMNGRPDVISDYRPSDANHPRASHVRIEMQMAMNSLCTRDGSGGVEFVP